MAAQGRDLAKEARTVARDRSKDRAAQEEALPEAMGEFLKKVVGGSLMRYDILRFFYDNSNAILTVSDLSTWMSRQEMPLARALQELAVLGYLGQSQASSAFALTSDREKRRRFEEFFGYLADNPEVAKRIRAQSHRPVEAA